MRKDREPDQVDLFATVLGYFLIPFAMKYLRATTVSIYTNLQPVVASLVVMGIKQDAMTWNKPVVFFFLFLCFYITVIRGITASTGISGN